MREMRKAQSAVARTASRGSGARGGPCAAGSGSGASMGSPARALSAGRRALLHPTGTRARGHHDSGGGACAAGG